MTANVKPEEAEALRDALDSSAGAETKVLQRDFSRPVRLSSHDLEGLERRLSKVVEDVEAHFSDVFGNKVPISLAALAEVSAADLFGEEEGPFATIRFEVEGQPAWVVWEPLPAIRAVEKALGSVMEVATTRRLSPIESTVLENLLAAVAESSMRALGTEAGGVWIVQSREALGSWQDAGDEADPHRLHLALDVEGPGGASRIDAYLPMGLAEKTAAADAPDELPEHLDAVDVEVSVRIQGCAVELSQLLELEEGDVIPLDGRVGDPAVFCVEGRPFATGFLGTRRGNLAVRIEQVHPGKEDLR